MTEDQFQTADQLRELIDITERAINSCNNTFLVKPIEEDNDGIPNLMLFEFSDESGAQMRLNRNSGNRELLKIIVVTLEKQLKEFKQEFKDL